MVQPQGSYEQRLAESCPCGWPVLHKFLNLGAFSGTDARQLLYRDCDTVFSRDVSALFDADADLVAREEVHAARTPPATLARKPAAIGDAFEAVGVSAP